MAQISPACAFVSGKTSLLEICSADGTLKTIQVAEDFSPVQKKDHKVVKDCAFCFFQAHIGKLPVSFKPQHDLVPTSYRVAGAGTIIAESMRVVFAQPRAPPFFS